MNKLEFGAKAKELRIKSGLTQTEVASALKMHFQEVSAIERGVRAVSLQTKRKLMSFYNIDYQEVATFLNKSEK